MGVVAPDDPPKIFELPGDVEIRAAPPERVALSSKRAGSFHAGMDQQDGAVAVVLGQGGSAQDREESIMPRVGTQIFAKLFGPSRERHHALPCRGDALVNVAAIGRQHGVQTVLLHPGQNLGRACRELDLQKLVPHLFLAAAQIDDVADQHSGKGEKGPPESEQLVDRRDGRSGGAAVVSEINQPLPWAKAAADQAVQVAKPGDVAMDSRHRPDALRAAQPGKFFVQGRDASGHERANRKRLRGPEPSRTPNAQSHSFRRNLSKAPFARVSWSGGF
jgi:hypothetical protein